MVPSPSNLTFTGLSSVCSSFRSRLSHSSPACFFLILFLLSDFSLLLYLFPLTPHRFRSPFFLCLPLSLIVSFVFLLFVFSPISFLSHRRYLFPFIPPLFRSLLFLCLPLSHFFFFCCPPRRPSLVPQPPLTARIHLSFFYSNIQDCIIQVT